MTRGPAVGLLAAALLAGAGCGHSEATSTHGSTTTAAPASDQGMSIAQALETEGGKPVSVRGYLFGFGATGGPSTILLCSGPGDPCVLPKLSVTGIDYTALRQLMDDAGALDGLLVNGDGFRETKPVVLSGTIKGNRLELDG